MAETGIQRRRGGSQFLHPAPPRNRLLAALPAAEWDALRHEARLLALPAGTTFRLPSQPVTSVYFPETGVISFVDELEGGHHVEVAAIGPEGLLGIATVLDLPRVPFWQVVQVATTGYEVPAPCFVRLFHESEPLRRMTMAHLGQLLVQLAHSATCNRFHSHRERLARWLVVLMTKSGQRSLALTHEFIAQMVGGPRHAVTAALQELRNAGAVDYLRGRIEIVDDAALVSAACACCRSLS